jgi:hypothetical protein
VRGRRTARLSDANTPAADCEYPEIPRHAGEQCETAPEGERDCHDRRPVALVGDASNRNSENGVEDSKPEAAHGADLEVVQFQLVLDRLNKLGDDLAIQEVDGVNRDEKGESVSPV